MDYDAMTLLDLKKLCKERGLKVGGRKDEVVIRLMEYDEALTGRCSAATAIPQVIPMHTAGGMAVTPRGHNSLLLETTAIQASLLRWEHSSSSMAFSESASSSFWECSGMTS